MNGHANPGVAILTYHRIDFGQFIPIAHRRWNIVTPASQLLDDFGYLARNAKVLPLPDAADLALSGSLPKHAVVLTFDDGFAEHGADLIPLLSSFKFHATLFVPGFVLSPKFGPRFIEWLAELEGRTGMRVEGLHRELRRVGRTLRTRILRELTRDLRLDYAEVLAAAQECYVSRRQLEEAVALGVISVGSHSMSHPQLSGLETAELEFEIRESVRLAREVDPAVGHSFAYPFGGESSFDDRCRRTLVALGCAYGVTSLPGRNGPDLDRLALKRFDMCRHSVPSVLQAIRRGDTGCRISWF